MTSCETFYICFDFNALLEGRAFDNSSSLSVDVGYKSNGIPLWALNDTIQCRDHLLNRLHYTKINQKTILH